MGKLYIFGNGLDLHYKLKTKPSDFVYSLNDKQIYNETDNAAEIFEILMFYGAILNKI